MTKNELMKRLISAGKTIGTAESLTAGMFSAMLADVPGASSVLNGGFVVYTNDMKNELLGIDKDLLVKYGAVSEQTAYNMAIEAKKRTGSDIGISATGNAGPDGSEGKEVGLVYIGCAYNSAVRVKRLNLVGERNKIRKETCNEMLTLIAEMLGI